MSNSKIELNDDKRKLMISDIKAFFLTEREEEIGELAALLVLDFFLDKLAPEAYNQGVQDSCQYMMKKVEDLMEIQK